MIPFNREARNRPEQVRFLAIARKMLDRLRDEQVGLLARAPSPNTDTNVALPASASLPVRLPAAASLPQ